MLAQGETESRKEIRIKNKIRMMIDHILRSGELERMRPMSIETISINSALPLSATSELTFFLATRTSRQAAHSSAEPRAVSKNLHRSLGVDFPLPSAIFSGTEVERTVLDSSIKTSPNSKINDSFVEHIRVTFMLIRINYSLFWIV